MKKILIVEDNLDLHEMLRIAFTLEGFETQSGFSGTEALECLQSFIPDIIFLDIMMPHMDGYQFLQVIASRGKRPFRIVAYSNLERPKDITNARNLGVDLFLKKSDYAPMELVQQIKKLL
ncbi:response regulator [Candidatus Gracilibacteria bacterium]|nr:response regulator [Candidatus Gracilibacteria bacterium]